MEVIAKTGKKQNHSIHQQVRSRQLISITLAQVSKDADATSSPERAWTIFDMKNTSPIQSKRS